MADAQDATRVTVTLSDQQLGKLKQLAVTQGISLNSALRQVLDIGSFIVDAKTERGTQILVKRGSGIEELELAS